MWPGWIEVCVCVCVYIYMYIYVYIYIYIYSAASGCQKKCAQKVIVTLFPYLFHIKTKWNIVYVYLKTKIFSRDKYPSPTACIKHKIFLDPQLQPLRVFGYHVTIQSLTSRKQYAQKNVWMQHWYIYHI